MENQEQLCNRLFQLFVKCTHFPTEMKDDLRRVSGSFSYPTVTHMCQHIRLVIVGSVLHVLGCHTYLVVHCSAIRVNSNEGKSLSQRRSHTPVTHTNGDWYLQCFSVGSICCGIHLRLLEQHCNRIKIYIESKKS